MSPPDDAVARVESERHELGVELMRIHRSTHGTGASFVQIEIAAAHVAVFFDALELSPSEEILIEAGERNSVIEQRNRLLEATEGAFRAAVERITGRRVNSFTTATKLDPPYSVGVFRLAPPA